MDTGSIFILILLSLVIGWVSGFYARSIKKNTSKSLTVSGEMKHRLQFLFDSYSDESIDRFIQSLEVTPETLPLHISIGKHFRSQGEVEKAILVHQNLMSHPELSSRVSEGVVYELAKDYKAAGLFDRAQALLQQLKLSKQFSIKSLKLLLDMYEAEKDWASALEEAARIDLKKYKEISPRVSQYYCELADNSLKEGLVRESILSYKKALSIYKECYRAHLGLAKSAIHNNDYNDAIYNLKLLIGVSPEHTVLAIPLLLEVTKATNSFDSHQEYLLKILKETGQVPVMLALVESMAEEGGHNKAVSFLYEYLQNSPSLSGLNKLIQFGVLDLYSPEKIISLVMKVLDVVYVGEQEFKCSSCGFTSSQIYWSCPSCKSWQTIKPRIEYEIDFQKKFGVS